MKKCSKTVSGKHAWITTRLIPTGVAGTVQATLDYPYCKFCGLINDLSETK